MAINMRNSLTKLLPQACVIVGTVTNSGGTPSLSTLSGDSIDQSCVSITDNGTGNYTISVTNFRGANGNLNGQATGTTISNMVSVTAKSYTSGTDTANFTFAVESDDSTAVDNGFDFILLAY